MSFAMSILLCAQGVPIAAPVVPEAELATQRGGFTLPNGIDVALTVQTQTAVNGAVVLRSVFRADHGTPTLTVYAPKPGETVAARTGATTGGTPAMPTITYDSRSGIQVTQVASGPTIAVASRAAVADAGEPGLARVDAGGPVATDNGMVSQATRGGLQSAELRADDLTITHLAGTAFGSAIANSGSDRAIDTTTTVGIDLNNAGPTMMASAALRIEDVAIGAMALRQ